MTQQRVEFSEPRPQNIVGLPSLILATLSGLFGSIKDAAMQASAVCKPDPSYKRHSEGSVLPQTTTMSVPPDYVSERYETFEEIAKGKFGVVFKCLEKSPGRKLSAVKIMSRRRNKSSEVEKEVAILKELQHPHLLEFRDFVVDEDSYILVTEYLGGGELFDYCAEQDYLFENETVLFLRQILDGLQYMHSKNICHLDLKPENIVLKDTETKMLKIIDFGTAQDISNNKQVSMMAGTPEFVAPEVANYDPVSPAADMWAVGVITFCLLTGCSPFLGDNDQETIQNVVSGEFDFPEEEDEGGIVTEHAQDFITVLLTQNPRERPSAEEVSKHKWLGPMVRPRTRTISTERLKRLRNRRKLQAAIRAVRLSVRLMNITKLRASSLSEESVTSTSPVSPSPTSE